MSAGTGERGDYVVVDDPHSADQAASDAERTAAVEWWNGSMSTRLNDPSRGHKIVIQQRLHEADLTGDLLIRHQCAFRTPPPVGRYWQPRGANIAANPGETAGRHHRTPQRSGTAEPFGSANPELAYGLQGHAEFRLCGGSGAGGIWG